MRDTSGPGKDPFLQGVYRSDVTECFKKQSSWWYRYSTLYSFLNEEIGPAGDVGRL